MTSAGGHTPTREFLEFVLWVLGASLGMMALGYLPTRSAAGQSGLAAMVGAIVVTALASVVGGLPVYRSRRSGRPSPQTVLVSMLLRLVVVALLAAAAVLGLNLAVAPFLVWLALAYLLLLVLDTRYAMTVLKSL